jgi:hypothetical protein
MLCDGGTLKILVKVKEVHNNNQEIDNLMCDIITRCTKNKVLKSNATFQSLLYRTVFSQHILFGFDITFVYYFAMACICFGYIYISMDINTYI